MRLFPVILFLLLISCDEESNSANLEKGHYHYDKGDYFFNKNIDSSFYHLNEARIHYEKSKDPRSVARSLMYLAIIQTFKGDYFGSNETSIEALENANTDVDKNEDLFYGIYNQFGLNYEFLKDYERSRYWYQRAYRAARNPNEKFIVATNLGIINYKQRKYKAAVNLYSKLLENKELKENKLLYARAVGNFAYSKFLLNKNYNAENQLLFALKTLELLEDMSGIRRVHSHLAEFYAPRNNSKALYHAKQELHLAKKMESPDRQLAAYQKIIMLERPENVKKYFLQQHQLADSLQSARAIARNQFALIRYGANKEKLENARKQNQILKMYYLLTVLSLALVFGIYWYRRRRRILEEQKAAEVKNTQLKYSKKVHDVVANGLYQTMMEVERQENFDRQQVLQALEKMYEESRDISHENIDLTNTSFSSQLGQMLSTFSSDGQQVFVVKNSDKIWENVSPHDQHEVLLALRELMTNMRKHSKATRVTVKFENSERELIIKYSDNGIGFNPGDIKRGKGLENTENRILGTGGKIIFGENEKGGLTVTIFIPLHRHV